MKKINVFSIVLSIVSIFLIFCTTMITASADNLLAVNARSAILADFNSGKIVYSLNEDKRYPIASMVKIMSLSLIFDGIKSGKISYDDDVLISDYACSMGGSQAFLDANQTYKAEELIKSIIVASANDSCVAMAEHIAGDSQCFVQLMNKKAKELNMNNTNYVNCTGLPTPNQYSSAGDVYKIFKCLVAEKDFYKFANVWMYDFIHPSGRKTTLTNTNKLVRFYKGCDGGKTGFTNEALSCLSATAKRGDTRLIAIVLGADNSKIRNKEISKMFNYGFSNYESKIIVDKEKFNDKVKLLNGDNKELNLTIKENYSDFVDKNSSDKYTTKLVCGAIKAPIKKGDIVGKLEIYKNDKFIKSIDVLADESIKQVNFKDLLEKLIKKW